MKKQLVSVLLAVILINCNSRKEKVPDPDPLTAPDGSEIPKEDNKVILSLTNDNKIFAGEKELKPALMDSLLGVEIKNAQRKAGDTVTVILHSDTTASYGTMFRIMRTAKKNGAKVVMNVKSDD